MADNKSNRFVEPKFTAKEVKMLHELWNKGMEKKPAAKQDKAATRKSK